MALKRSNRNDGSWNRREFAQWLASAAALACSPLALGQGSEPKGTYMFLRPGDPYSDPQKLRKRFDRGGIDIDQSMAGKALQWRVLQDPFAAGLALGELAKSRATTSSNWYEVAMFVMTADWLSDYERFTPAMKAHVGDLLLAKVQKTIPLEGMDEPGKFSFNNVKVRSLTMCVFALMGAARMTPGHASLAPLQAKLDLCLRNVMEQMQFCVPDGSTHESMDYMRISYAPLVMLTELRRTLLRQDIAEQISTFANMGQTYLYMMLPDGTFARGGDNEKCVFNTLDPLVLGYAVHRFQDRYAAWVLRNTPDMPRWQVPAMQFLWDDPTVVEANPFTASPKDLKLARHFRGVDHVVFRSGFSEKDTRIAFSCGPYFAKHQHLDRNHFTIQHRGLLAIDSGADYTNSESPHYLNYYRRSVAHNTMLVYDPAERFFWGEDAAAAANDGGQRMDSVRYWNTIRSVQDWQATREQWDIGRLHNVELGDSRYMYALGDATKAYSASKMTKFTRELLFFPAHDVLFVFDEVESSRAELRKSWLLHTVHEPELDVAPGGAAEAKPMPSAGLKPMPNATLKTARVSDRDGEMLVHTLLPEKCAVTKVGGPGKEFYTPGNASGGAWGSGRNWPVDPAAGGPVPTDPEESTLWRTFYGADFKKLSRSDRTHAEPGAWRIEVTPAEPAKVDIFFHAFEMGPKGKTGKTPAVRLHGPGYEGALCGRMVALFVKAEHGQKALRFTLPPAEPVDAVWMRGLPHSLEVTLDFFDGTVPVGKMAMPLFSATQRVTPRGTVMVTGQIPAGARVSVRVGVA